MIQNILVPIDGSEYSDRAVEHAVSLAEVYGAKLHFLYVASTNQLAINASLSDAILAAVKKAGQVILDRAADLVPEGIEYNAVQETGMPAVSILDYIRDNSIDMVVMGSRGLSVVQGIFLGSISQYVMERAKCPIVIVK